MEASEDTSKPTSVVKTRSTRARKVKAVDEANGKRSLNLSLSHEDYERLALHALDAKTTISDLVSVLARTHLRRVHLTRVRSE